MNKWTLIKGVCALFTAGALSVACTDAKHEAPEAETQSQFRVNAKEIMEDPDLAKNHKAEKLVEAGEQLLLPETFHLADAVFKQALNINPSNKKAQLYNMLLKPSMNLKGILKRIEPLVEKDDREYPAYKEQLDRKEFFVQGYHNGRIYGPAHSMWTGSYLPVDFLVDNTDMPSIHTESELQEFVRSQVDVFNEVRQFLNKTINTEIEIKLSERWQVQRASSRSQICRFTIITDFDYNIECSEDQSYMTTKIDRGDMEALKTLAAGMQLYHIIGSSYDVTATQKHMMDLRQKDNFTDRYKIEKVLNENSKTATLNEDHMLNQIISLGKDGMIAARWIRENHVKMCPGPNDGIAFTDRGYEWDSEKQEMVPRRVLLPRQGYLFDRGICWDKIAPDYNYKELGKVFDTIDKALAGEIVEMQSQVHDDKYNGNFENYPEKITARIKPSVLFTQPLQDLREVRPSEYNDCGEIKKLSDDTLGGVFVDGDANTFLDKTNEINKRSDDCEVPL